MATTVADADVLITADVSKFAADLRRKLDPIMRAINATLDILADATQFEREVNDLVRETDRRNATIKVEADTSGVSGDVRAVQADIDRRSATIHVNVDVDKEIDRQTGGFTRLFGKLGGDSGNAFSQSMNKNVTSGLSSLSSTIPTAISNPVVIGVAAILEALVLIPAAAFVAATAIAGIGIGFLGLGALALKSNQEVSSAFENMVQRIQKTFTDAAEPLIQPLVKAFGIIGDAVEKIGPQLKEAFGALAPQIENLAEGFGGFIENVMPGLVDILIAAGPLIEEFAKQLPGLGDALSTFFQILALAGPDSVDALKLAFGLLKIVLIAVASTILGLTLAFGLLVDAGRFVVELINQLLLALFGFDLTVVIEAVKQFTFEAIIAIGDFISGATTFLSQLPTIFINFVTQAVNGAISFFSSGIATLVGIASAVPGQIYNAVVAVVGLIGSVFSSAANSAVSALSNGIGSLVSLAASIPGRIRGVIGDLSGVLVSAGRSIIQGLINGINDRLGALRSTLSSITSLIPKIKGPEDVDKKLLTPAGKFIMEGLITGIDSGVDDLERKLRGVTSLFSPTVQTAAANQASAAGLTPRFGETSASTTNNSRTFAPVINVNVAGGDADAAANAIVRRLLAVGV